jgi:hypothetical protein
VHAVAVPTGAARPEQGAFRELGFRIVGLCQGSDLEGAHLLAVSYVVLLGNTDDAAALVNERAPAWAGLTAVVHVHWAAGVLDPAAGEVIGVEQVGDQVGGVAGEQPPGAVVVENGRIVVRITLDQLSDLDPVVGEVLGFVEEDRMLAVAFRDHVILAVGLKDLRVGEMKGLGQDDAVVGPLVAVWTASNANPAAAHDIVVNFEEHIPAAALVEEERVGNKLSGYVGDLGGGQDRVGHAGSRYQVEGVDGDAGPVGQDAGIEERDHGAAGMGQKQA